MKAARLFCGGAILLLLANFAWADEEAGKHYPPAATVEALVKDLKDRIPQGWSIAYDKDNAMIEVDRDHETLCDSVAINGSPFDKPEKVKVKLALEIVPFVSSVQYKRLDAENKQLQKKLDVIDKELRAGGAFAGKDGYMNAGHGDAAEISYYNGLKKKLHAVPEFRYRDISLDTLDGPWVPIDDAVAQEYREVIKKIEGALEKY